MRKLAGASVLGVLLVMVVFGAAIAWADDAIFARQYNTPTWTPASNEPSGIAHIAGGQYLVVDTNLNNSGTNGWLLTAAPQPPGTVTNVGSGVGEPTGVDYHEASDTLFVSSDASDGFITVFQDWTPGDTSPSLTIDTLDVAQTFDPLIEAADTEDPAFDGRYLYWASGSDQFIYWRDTVDGTFDGTDTYGRAPITMEQPDPLDLDPEYPDWEAMTWDPVSSRLLLASRHSLTLYHLTVDTVAGTVTVAETDDLDIVGSEGDLGDIAGMTIGPASYDDARTNLFVTSRFSHTVIELTIDGMVAPNTTTTSSSSTSSSSSSSSSSTSSTSTTMATTTTTTPGTTTTTTTQPEPVGGATFIDTAGHTHENAIAWLAAEGITQGCNPPLNDMFCPNDNVTRGQMAAFLVRAFDYTDAGTGDYFKDTVGNTFETAIDRLRVAGITQGCNPPDNDEYCPSDNVTRGQMAAFLVRAFGFTDSGTGNYFTDTDGVFKSAIDRLRVAGVTLGCNPPDNDRYCPDDLVTRGQMATFLKRGFDGLG